MLRQLGRKEVEGNQTLAHPSSGANWIPMFIQIGSLLAHFTCARALSKQTISNKTFCVYSGYTKKDENNVNQMNMWRLTMIAVAQWLLKEREVVRHIFRCFLIRANKSEQNGNGNLRNFSRLLEMMCDVLLTWRALENECFRLNKRIHAF